MHYDEYQSRLARRRAQIFTEIRMVCQATGRQPLPLVMPLTAGGREVLRAFGYAWVDPEQRSWEWNPGDAEKPLALREIVDVDNVPSEEDCYRSMLRLLASAEVQVRWSARERELTEGLAELAREELAGLEIESAG